MSWTPTDEQVEKATEALREVLGFGDTPLPSLTPDARNGYMRQMHAVLVAVGPHLAAQALRDAADPKNATWPRGMYGSPDDMFARRDLLNRAAQIEKEAGR